MYLQLKLNNINLLNTKGKIKIKKIKTQQAKITIKNLSSKNLASKKYKVFNFFFSNKIHLIKFK